jgi:archaellum component FlaC
VDGLNKSVKEMKERISGLSEEIKAFESTRVNIGERDLESTMSQTVCALFFLYV